MTAERTNLRVLEPSRRRRSPGDIFVAQIRPTEYLFGCLVKTDAHVFPNVPCNLIYIYRATSTDARSVPTLSVRDLLIPPYLTNQKPWTLGYLKMVENRPLSEADLLPTHCFADSSGRFWDEYAQWLKRRHEPCGQWGVGNHRTLDDAVSLALGIPLVPD